MTRKTTTHGLGRGIAADRKRQEAAQRSRAAQAARDELLCQGGRSVIEHTSLDDLIATVELRRELYAEAVGDAEYVETGPTLLSTVAIAEAEHRAACDRELVSIPRRPQWHEGMSTEELAKLETDAFIEWRKALAQATQREDLHLTPFERNLDFWRQLWRCIERSDLLVQIVDARDPHFYQCQDLQKYTEELGGSKQHVLLVNKADFLTAEQRAAWAQHFQKQGVDAVFFSALREVRRQQPHNSSTSAAAAADAAVPAVPAAAADSGGDELASAIAAPVPDSSDDESEAGASPSASPPGEGVLAESEDDPQAAAPLGPLPDDALDVVDSAGLLEELLARLPRGGEDMAGACPGSEECDGRRWRGTVGFVGYPNVGKSTVINALMGAKKVGMSSRPGKTKHIQTLEIPAVGVTFCDCPGLVFPSVAATKAHLVINNTVPLDDLREVFAAVHLIVEKVGWHRLLEHYGCSGSVCDAAKRSGDHKLDAAHNFLAALAVSRSHVLRVGVPDENWAARKVLRDYVSGELLHCEPPPPAEFSGVPCDADTAAEGGSAAPAREEEEIGDTAAGALVEGAADQDCEGGIDDFEDLDAFMEGGAPRGGRRMTKRRERYLRKQELKGGPVTSVGTTGIRTCGKGRA